MGQGKPYRKGKRAWSVSPLALHIRGRALWNSSTLSHLVGGLLFSIHTCRILQDPLEGVMLKLKLQYFGHLMQRTDSFEKTLMLGKIEGDDRG